MPIMLWALGPDEIECEVDVDVHRGKRATVDPLNDRYDPGSGSWAEVTGAVAVEDGARRMLTDDEELLLDDAEDAIKEKAIRDEFCVYGVWSRWWE